MKIIRAIFLAELRGHRALALGIVTLLGLQGMLQTYWIYDATPMISLSVQAILALLCVLLLSKSLWQDAPLRKERYLATRPTNLLKLYVGKYAAFLLIVAIPFAVVEWLTVRYLSFDFRIQATATLQAFLFAALSIASYIPCIWLMHSKKSIVFLWIVLICAAWASNSYFGKMPNTYINEWSAGVPYSPFMTMIILAVFASITSIRLMRLKQWHSLITSAIMAVTAFWSIQLAIKICTQKRPVDTAKKMHLVEMLSYSPGHSNVSVLRVAVPFQESDRQTASQWSFNDVSINGKNYTPWYDDIYAMRPRYHELFSVISERYPTVKELNPGEDMSRDASFSVPRDITEQPIDYQSFILTQKRFRWKIVIDLPYQVGEKASSSSISCHIGGNHQPQSHSPIFTKNIRDFRVVTVTQCKPFSKSNSDYVFGQNHLVILLDPATGSTSFMPRRNLFNPPKNFQLPQFFYDEFNSSRLPSNNDEGKRFTTHARLLILVPDFITSQSFQWSHSVSNREETPKRVNTGKRFTAKQSPDAWLAANPIPSSNASYAEREAWVSKLIDYSHANPLVANLRQDSPLMLACINNIEHIAKAQHEGRLPEGFIMHDIVKYYDRDFLKKYPNIAHSSEVIWYWQRKGWTVDLIDIARDALRAGKGGAFSGIILAEPQLMNLSSEEWIDYFSLNCNGVTYQKMKDRILPAEILNQIADQFLLYRNDVDLGLARGHADAPRWMKRSALTPNSFYIYHLGEQLTNHFELPAPIPPYIIDHRLKKEPIIQWLEKFDPDAYVYDSAKQKYILKPTP